MPFDIFDASGRPLRRTIGFLRDYQVRDGQAQAPAAADAIASQSIDVEEDEDYTER